MSNRIPDGFEEIDFKSAEAPVVAEQEEGVKIPEVTVDDFLGESLDNPEDNVLEQPSVKEGEGGEEGDEDGEDLPGQSKEANHAFREMRKALEEIKRENAELKARDEEKQREKITEVEKAEVDKELVNLNLLKQKLKTLPQQIYDAAIGENIHDAIAKSMASNAELKLQVAIIQEQERIKAVREQRSVAETRKAEALNAKAEEFVRDHEKLRAKYGEVVPELDRLDEGTVEKMRNGSSLYDAFVSAHEDDLFAAKIKDAQRQGEVVAKSKDHLKSEKGGGSAGATKAPPDIVRLYRKFNSTWTEKQIYEMWKEDEKNKRKKG